MSHSFRVVRSFFFLMALSIWVTAGCSSGGQKKPSHGGRSYLDQVNRPLTESWNAEVRGQVERLKTAMESRDRVTARVVGTVTPAGNVLSVRVAKSSGIKLVDDLAMQAFRLASPLPPPPVRAIRDGTVQVAWDATLTK